MKVLTDSNFAQTIDSDKHVLVAFTGKMLTGVCQILRVQSLTPEQLRGVVVRLHSIPLFASKLPLTCEQDCKALAPAWESLAETFSQDAFVVVAKVDEAEQSKATASSQGVTSYPTIKYFAKGTSKGEVYDKSRAPADLVAFMNQKSGTHRLLGGDLDAEAGTVDVLDSIVAKISDWKAAPVLDDITKVAKGLKDKYADYYVKVAGKMKASQDYAVQEAKRLEGILKRGGLAAVKKDEVTSRVNILRKFIGTPEGKDEL